MRVGVRGLGSVEGFRALLRMLFGDGYVVIVEGIIELASLNKVFASCP